MESEWELTNLAQGHSYNINTGEISFDSADTEGTLLYLKNTQENLIFADGIFVSAGAGTQSDSGIITVIENPTGGDLISDADDALVAINRLPSADEDLFDLADIYKGKSGGTITGGEEAGVFHIVAQMPRFIPIPFALANGDSIAFKLKSRLSSGTMNVITDLAAHVEA